MSLTPCVFVDRKEVRRKQEADGKIEEECTFKPKVNNRSKSAMRSRGGDNGSGTGSGSPQPVPAVSPPDSFSFEN